ncbi:peptide deformylase [Kiloniella litopenaei]|uniref:Peptide deformylase n=1 Tax=Kiloniella litopenaei TaxID=1549748 RepID=A0A0M2RE87_9PROT|nr:peptide deformylase [Kiloniella litopenaei]KKJ77878.1 peptide deformylase [Kiloniella litopenaei]
MAILDIVIAPDPVLKTVCEPVKEVNDEIRELLKNMLETMYKAPGIGLAACQVGVTKRVIVVDVSDDKEENQPYCMVNPEITWESDEYSVYQEGCLSLPEQYADVERPAAIKLRYLDETGKQIELEADGLLATCIQHEIDHLDGVLFVDHISKLKRGMIMKKLKKVVAAKAAG